MIWETPVVAKTYTQLYFEKKKTTLQSHHVKAHKIHKSQWHSIFKKELVSFLYLIKSQALLVGLCLTPELGKLF